jgi:large subunit ribosomal protein L21
MYAIIRSGGRQYRVREGDSIAVERLDGDAGDQVTFDEVLLIEDDGSVSLGAPTVAGASVTGQIDEQFRGRKLLAMKYKNKTRSRTVHGHRQHQTRVRITAIRAG